MIDLLSKIYVDLNELVIRKVPHDKEILSTRVIKEHTKICEYCFNIKSSNKDKNCMLEFKVSIKYILFILNYFVSKKIINNDVYKYKLEGNKIIFRQNGNNVLYFIYEVDNVIGFIYNNQTYYYNKNLQNDIISIRNSDNEIIVNYEYDN